eukprot:3863401-Rhodomonas_salina.1
MGTRGQRELSPPMGMQHQLQHQQQGMGELGQGGWREGGMQTPYPFQSPAGPSPSGPSPLDPMSIQTGIAIYNSFQKKIGNNSTQHSKSHELVTVCNAVTDLGWLAGKEVAQFFHLLGCSELDET